MAKLSRMSLVAGLVGAFVLPLTLASSASAATSSGCTITPLKPVFAGFNSSGVKLVNYRISVSCTAGRTAFIQQQRWEDDDFFFGGSDDYLGTTSFSTYGVRTLNNVRTLVNTEGGNEEVFQKVRFQVSSNGVTSPWTGWQNSSTLSILD